MGIIQEMIDDKPTGFILEDIYSKDKRQENNYLQKLSQFESRNHILKWCSKDDANHCKLKMPRHNSDV